MDILIVGGNGFMGSNLAGYLLSRDPSVNIMNIDVSRQPRTEEIMGLNDPDGRYSFKDGSITDLSTYEHYLKVSDVVVNCASERSGPHFMEGMERYVRTNVLGARMLADSACRSGVPLVHISSDEVYGSCPETVHRRDESSPLDPTNSFAATLAAGERLVSIAGKKTGIPVVIARPCELIGPNQPPDGIVPGTIRDVNANRPPIVRDKGGERYRDWLHVLDLCSALHLLIDSVVGSSDPERTEETEDLHSHPGSTVISGTSVGTVPSTKPEKRRKRAILSGVSIFNITSEMRYPITDVVKRTMEVLGSDLPLQETSGESYTDLGYNASGRKMAYHGWQAKYNDIERIIGSTVEWYGEYPEFLHTSPSSRLMP